MALELHYAIEDGDFAKAMHLLAQGVTPDEQDDFEQTALFYGVSSGSAEMVSALLAAGADPCHQDAAGWTPKMYALADSRKSIVSILDRHDWRPGPNAASNISSD